jgi:glycerol uptake facilitator-like aquaporin
LSVGNYPPFEGHPDDPNPFRLVYVAIIVFFLICFAGPISGAHINPAVSIALHLNQPSKSRSYRALLTYITAQILGTFLGIWLSYWIYGNGGPLVAELPEMFEMSKECIE